MKENRVASKIGSVKFEKLLNMNNIFFGFEIWGDYSISFLTLKFRKIVQYLASFPKSFHTLNLEFVSESYGL